MHAISNRYGAERIASKPYSKEQSEQLTQSVPVLLFLVGAGEPVGYEQQMRFVKKMIYHFKNCRLGRETNTPVDSSDEITCINVNRWDESKIRKLIIFAVGIGRDIFRRRLWPQLIIV